MSSDPVHVLTEITRRGFCSRIWYDKRDGRGPSERLIEPRVLLEGRNGLLIRSIQLEPVRGVRAFNPLRIVKIEGTQTPLVSAKNEFGSGAVVLSKRGTGSVDSLDDPRLVDYMEIVRDAVNDLDIEPWERELVANTREDRNLTLGEVRATHAYIFAEALIGYAVDGDVDPNEEEHIEQLARCLDELGWSPA